MRLHIYIYVSLWDNTTNEPSIFRAKNWVEINDGRSGAYSTNDPIIMKSAVLKSSSCGYGDAYISIKGTIIVPGVGTNVAVRLADERYKQHVHHLLTA